MEGKNTPWCSGDMQSRDGLCNPLLTGFRNALPDCPLCRHTGAGAAPAAVVHRHTAEPSQAGAAPVTRQVSTPPVKLAPMVMLPVPV